VKQESQDLSDLQDPEVLKEILVIKAQLEPEVLKVWMVNLV
jgi:hypothetical protein